MLNPDTASSAGAPTPDAYKILCEALCDYEASSKSPRALAALDAAFRQHCRGLAALVSEENPCGWNPPGKKQLLWQWIVKIVYGADASGPDWDWLSRHFAVHDERCAKWDADEALRRLYGGGATMPTPRPDSSPHEPLRGFLGVDYDSANLIARYGADAPASAHAAFAAYQKKCRLDELQRERVKLAQRWAESERELRKLGQD